MFNKIYIFFQNPLLCIPLINEIIFNLQINNYIDIFSIKISLFCKTNTLNNIFNSIINNYIILYF